MIELLSPAAMAEMLQKQREEINRLREGWDACKEQLAVADQRTKAHLENFREKLQYRDRKRGEIEVKQIEDEATMRIKDHVIQQGEAQMLLQQGVILQQGKEISELEEKISQHQDEISQDLDRILQLEHELELERKD